MRTTRRILRCLLLTAVLFVSPTAMADAEDLPIYESLSEVPIGRVFFTPKQRISLDQRRHSTATRQAVRSGSRPKAVNPDAAGYIVSASGKKSVYRDGDFVAAVKSAEVKFPGDVRVLRQPEASEDSADASD